MKSSCVYCPERTPIVSQYFEFIPRPQESAQIAMHMRRRQLARKGIEVEADLIDKKQLKSIMARDTRPSSGNKRFNPIIVVPGCPGIGKSSFLVNFPLSDVKGLWGNESEVIVSALTFADDMAVNKDVAGLRVLFGAACSMSGLKTNSWVRFLSSFREYHTLEVVNAVTILNNVYGRSKRVLILVDEIKDAPYIPIASPVKKKVINKMMEQLGSALASTGCDVVVSALSPHYTLDLITPSGRNVQYCILPPLWNSWIGSQACSNWTDMVIDELRNVPYSNKDEFNFRFLRSMYLLASGHPRMLESLVDDLKHKSVNYGNVLSMLSNNKTSVSSLLVHFACKMESSYSLSVADLDRAQCINVLHKALSSQELAPSLKSNDFVRK